jgi:tRNA (mo5U34)-methyltransferase
MESRAQSVTPLGGLSPEEATALTGPEHIERLRAEVQRLTWVHTIDLGGGVVTPGQWPANPLITAAFDTVDFRDKKVLDIGCWDGLWSFEAERRGAREVHATDLVTQRWGSEQPTFALAHRALRSKARYRGDVSVYDVAKVGIRDFDVVIFCGIYYHLKDPLLAFARLRQVMAEGGVLIIEGPAIYDPVRAYARFYYGQRLADDPTNWWVPTVACLREWVTCNYFAIRGEHRRAPVSWREALRGLRQRSPDLLRDKLAPRRRITRYVLTAQAVRRHDPEYLFEDAEVGQFHDGGYAT